ncbi:MAG TPA: sigma-54-dependent Fis family transcriptional regulator [candidate division Zixibacteria bacterium]|nr:sigma-54-dependent Fis family transcriptional regulator [candidate division Zixibacteria bacterium]
MSNMILVVDDDKLVNEFVNETLTRAGFKVHSALSGAEALKLMQENEYDLILTDVRMPEMDGITLLMKIKAVSPDSVVVVITAYGTIENAVDAMRKGAYDYILKPFSPDEIEIVVRRGLEHRALAMENKVLRAQIRDKYSFENIVGQNRKLLDIFDLIQTAANSKATILLTGESGTGKELVAKAIHYNSPRKDMPFIRINCAALPENLIESELFGHEKGAFTGAIKQTKGRFELADGGSLLLDEVSEMDLGLQAKLLRVLQESEFERVGSGLPVKVDVRLIATSNRNLMDEVRKGKFREDLYYRLNVINIEIPPLRERKDDLPLLIEHFIQKFNEEDERHIEGLSEKALRLLQSYPWPGNVRELENLIHRAVVTSKNSVITHMDFPSYLALGPNAEMSDMLSEPITISEGEKILILKSLERHAGNRTKAAEELGITTRTLRNKLHEYGMTDN